MKKNFQIKKNYYFQSDDVIGRGEEEIKETLKGLNYKFNDNDEDSFYFIKTKIKLFDDLGLDKSLKEMIYLIDFPGYGTGNFFEKGICNKVISICNLFVFVSRNSVIKNKDNKSALDSFIQAKENKKKFSSQFIKSCLFVFNKDINQSSTKDDIEKAKNDIQSLIKGIDKNDINLTFFNAKFFINFCSFYNYFYNLEETLKIEYENYNNNKYKFFINPFSNNNIINNSFPDYLINILAEKTKQISEKIKKNQKYDKHIEESINNFFKEKKEYTNKHRSNIIKLLSFCKENINKIDILNESNVEEFKKNLKSLIIYINENKQKELRESIDNVISILDMFFGKNFQENKKDKKEINDFIQKMKDLKINIQSLINENKKKTSELIENCKKDTLYPLYQKKNEMEKLLSNNGYESIIKEINSEIEKNNKNFVKKYIEYLEENDLKCSKLFNETKEVINNFKINKIINISKYNFKQHLSNIFGDGKKDLNTEIMDEIQSRCQSLYDIFKKKGVKEWFFSLFSSNKYMLNVIDMVVETYSSKIEDFLKMVEKESDEYLTKVIKKINYHIKSCTMEFNDNQQKK